MAGIRTPRATAELFHSGFRHRNDDFTYITEDEIDTELFDGFQKQEVANPPSDDDSDTTSSDMEPNPELRRS